MSYMRYKAHLLVVLTFLVGFGNAQKEGESIDAGNFVTFGILMPTFVVCTTFGCYMCYKRYRKRKRAHKKIKRKPVSNYYESRLNQVQVTDNNLLADEYDSPRDSAEIRLREEQELV